MACPYGTTCYVLIALAVIYIASRIFKPSARRAPTLPAVPWERTTPRGTGQLIECVAPATGRKLGEARAYTPEEVKAAYEAARVASEEWKKTSFTERRALLQDILDWVVEHQDEIITHSVNDSGKTVAEASLGEVMTTCEKLRWVIAHGEKCLAREGRPVATLLSFTKKAYVEWMPLGVIGVIVPWNYPVHNVFSAVTAALFAGNGAVVKVSEFASNSAAWMEENLRRLIARRGHNPDLVQIVTGYAETGAALVKSGVDKILFIGSPQVGALIMQAAAPNLTPVILELGGKDPFIVFADCEWDQMIDAAIRGAFINCGQNCVGAERFYVQDEVYGKFCADIIKRMKELRIGASSTPADEAAGEKKKCCDFGSMTMGPQVRHVEAFVQDAIQRGAKVLHGGRRGEGELKEGLFFEPTVLADVTHEMKIANEETFGPVMSIIRFRTEEEVVRMANSTNFGLGSCVFTTDYKKANRVAKQLYTGMVNINDFSIVPTIQSLPFGGVKKSGFGHFNGKEGLRGFSLQKSVVTDRFPFLRTKAPGFLVYPMHSKTHLIVKEALKMVYGRGWFQSAGALVRMLGLAMSKSER